MWRACSVILGLGFTWACSSSAQAAEEMQTRVFRMRPAPHDFPGVVPPPPVDARKVLEEAGVAFPAGAEVAFDPLAGFLMVTNTAANLELTRAFVEKISLPQAPTIAFMVTAVAGPGELIRQMEAAATGAEDASKELNLLLSHANNPGSRVRVIGDCFLESTTGTQTRRSIEEEKQTRSRGLKLMVGPTLASDGRSIESTLDLDLPGTPFSAYLRAQSGQTKLAGVTRPAKTAKEADGMLWAVFVTATVRRSAGVAMVTLPVVIEDSEAAAAGLETAVFQVPDGLLEAAGDVPFALQPWLASQGITFDAGAKVSHKGGVLRMTNTQVNIGRMTVLVERCLEGALKAGLWTLHTFEAPATLLRDLAQRTATRTDDAAMLAAVQAAAEKGEARCVDFVFLDAKPDAQSQWQAGHDRWQVSSLDQDAAGRLRLGLGPRFVGTRLEVEMATSPYSRRLEVEVSHEIHPPGPDEEPLPMIDPDTGKPRDLPAMNYHPAKTRRKLALLPGDTRLLSLQEPVGRSAPDMLWATFLRCTTPPSVPPPPPPPAEKKDAGAAPDPQGWETRSFRLPPDFLTSCCVPEPDKPRLTERDILEIQGVPFPPGATAVFTPATRTLQVRNTRENLGLVEAYVKAITANPPATIVLDAQILQGPGNLLRRMAVATTGRSDHRAALDELLAAVKAGTVRRIDTARITTRSGTRASSARTTEHTHHQSVGMDDKGAAVFEQEKRAVGWSLKMEPTIGADGSTVYLTVESEFHTGEPQEHVQNVLDHGRLLEVPLAEYHSHRFQTHLSMPGGTARLVSVWRPTGKPEFEKEDILQVMFLTCDVQRGPVE